MYASQLLWELKDGKDSVFHIAVCIPSTWHRVMLKIQ